MTHGEAEPKEAAPFGNKETGPPSTNPLAAPQATIPCHTLREGQELSTDALSLVFNNGRFGLSRDISGKGRKDPLISHQQNRRIRQNSLRGNHTPFREFNLGERPISGTPPTAQGKAQGVDLGAKEGDRQGVSIGEIFSSMMLEEDGRCRKKETKRPNKTMLVAPKSPTPRHGERGEHQPISGTLTRKGAKTHSALVYNRRRFGSIRDKSGKLCFFVGRGGRLRFVEGQKRRAITELLVVTRVDPMHPKVQGREGAESVMRIEATIEADPSIGQ